MEKKSVNLSDEQLINQILEVNDDIKKNPYDYEIESEKIYNYLLSRLLKKYSILSLAEKNNLIQMKAFDNFETKLKYEEYLKYSSFPETNWIFIFPFFRQSLSKPRVSPSQRSRTELISCFTGSENCPNRSTREAVNFSNPSSSGILSNVE